MSDCWTEVRVEAAVASDATDGDVAHLDECATCRARLAAARRDARLLDELRRTVDRSASADPERDLVPGYRIESEIRRGGQGVVYRAVQVSTHRAVALKLLDGKGARERRRFEREIELVARLDHPYVVVLLDTGMSGDLPWYAMDLVDGVPLDEWTSAHQPDVRARVELAARVASAVAHAHQRGVIHRDLKPSNVLVDRAGEPRVLDFGAALSAVEHRERLRVTAPGEFVGTVAYAAPEQLRGADAAIDTRTDVYALGLILYELLTGRLPHEQTRGLAGIVEHAEATETEPPSARARGIDRDLDAIVLRALARDPSERYGTAGDLHRDLERFLAGEPVQARPHSSFYLFRKLVARRRKRVFAAAAIAVGVATGGSAWLLEHQRAERQREQAGVVRSLMQELLGAASPQRMGGDARLVDVYEVVARGLDCALADAPDVQAEVELTIGDTNRRLLRAAEAEPHLRKALARFREIDGSKKLEVARAANLLSLTLADQNRPEAIDVAEEALAIRERALAPEDPLLAESRRTLAIALLDQFRETEGARARELLQQSLAGFRAAYGPDHPEVAETWLRLARTEPDLAPGQVEAALAQAEDIFERLAPDDPRGLEALEARAASLQRNGRFDEARATLDRASALARRLFGDALTTDLLRRYARLEFARGDMQTAELLSRRAVAHELECWAARQPGDAVQLRSLARRLEEPGSPAAEPPFAAAFAELRRLEGDGTFELAQWMNGIALTLRAAGRGSATEPLLREALEIRCRAMGRDCPVRQRSIELLATELADEERGAEAIEWLEESRATCERQGSESAPEAEKVQALLDVCRAQATREAAASDR